ncbi:hypothetical protein PE066_02775 [Ramlibacter tataouinensis]|uniref:hypothetical protein n=1 Tax=Ramlibacter tataouinensis TaxID=94132 RepID=UPI0022F3E3D4|nr:hypothetical protein [Ramlibacter tataouinensis]WBY02479.1 hypothetical protein PE066_02775 [Ramlibacter tataouinensis]
MPAARRRRASAPGRALALAAWAAGAALLVPATGLAQAPAPRATLPGVTITYDPIADPVEKSYRRMVRGMDLFERERARSPQGQLRFKLLPRKPGVDLDRLELLVLGASVEIPLAVAPDRSFVLPRNAKAWAEDAKVTPDRKALTMTWRAEVRTPGLPPGTRRLGDLRLECRVGMEAGLYSNSPSFITRIFSELSTTPAYCGSEGNRYLLFADRPIFGVTLVSGERRETVPAARLWAGAIDEANLARELPYCDCEVLLDRTYFLPLADAGWPDETRVVFDYMEAHDAAQ